MSNYLNIPLVLPFKFYPNTANPGTHFDDNWAYTQIRNFEMKQYYFQKWNRSVTTKLQITTTIEPETLKLLDSTGAVVKSFTWSIAAIGSGGENAWECTFDVQDVATDGKYFLYQKNELLSVLFEAISEPIYIKDDHRNVRVLRYKNSVNDFGVIWTTGIEMKFMCEVDMMDYDFQRDRNAYVDQVHNVNTLSAYPFRTAKLFIGEAPGVAPYVVDIVNRILCCDTVKFDDLQIETTESAKMEVTRAKGYPLIGASIEVTLARNLSSLQFNDEDALSPGIVTAYNIDTNFFGSSNIVHITDIELT